jgi:hypothetical protein
MRNSLSAHTRTGYRTLPAPQLVCAEICGLYEGARMRQDSTVCVCVRACVTGICMQLMHVRGCWIEGRYLSPYGCERQRRCGLMVAEDRGQQPGAHSTHSVPQWRSAETRTTHNGRCTRRLHCHCVMPLLMLQGYMRTDVSTQVLSQRVTASHALFTARATHCTCHTRRVPQTVMQVQSFSFPSHPRMCLAAPCSRTTPPRCC